MLFSAFSGFGAFKFSSKPTHGQNIYNAMVAAKQGAFDMSVGSYEECKTYAQAMGLARARYTVERARNQADPLKAVELLPQLERDWGVVPSETDTLLTRQQTVASRMALVRGARREALETALRAIFGADFIELRATLPAEAVTDMGAGIANFAAPAAPYKIIKLTAPVVVTGAPSTVAYGNLDATQPTVLAAAGDIFVVEPSNASQREIVTVTSATATTITATFTKSHDQNAIATTQNWVGWSSTQRRLYIVVKAASASNADRVRQANDFMARAVRGTTVWHVVQPTTPGASTMGPFTLNVTSLGTSPIGSMAL